MKPTLQMKGKIKINDDTGLEREADVMGVKAMQLGGESTGMEGPSSSVQRRLIAESKVVQRVGVMKNSGNDCFMIAAIQVIQGSYDKLFNPEENKVNDENIKCVQETIWKILSDLKSNKTIEKERVETVRKKLKENNIVQSLDQQEDAQETFGKLVNLMIDKLTKQHSNKKFMLERFPEAWSSKNDIVRDVEQNQYSNDPAKMSPRPGEVEHCRPIVEIDINTYKTFKSFLANLYGQGQQREFSEGNYLKVRHNGKQVYVKARYQKYTFTMLPKVLTFYVKRFRGQEKNTNNFMMPEDLFLVEKSSKDNKKYKKYKLQSILLHSGGQSINSGHYTTLQQVTH